VVIGHLSAVLTMADPGIPNPATVAPPGAEKILELVGITRPWRWPARTVAA
jgi:hypothetical protein